MKTRTNNRPDRPLESALCNESLFSSPTSDNAFDHTHYDIILDLYYDWLDDDEQDISCSSCSV